MFRIFLAIGSALMVLHPEKMEQPIMKKFGIVAFISILLLILSNCNLMAQRRPESTRSAQAAYGDHGTGYHAKKKKSKKNKRPKKQKQKKSKTNKSDTSQPAYRKKSPWAN